MHLGRVGLGVGDDDLLLVDLDRPVQVGLRVPLRLLGLLVELVELRLGALLVVPGELGRAVVGDAVEALDVVVADEAQHRLEVVDALPADQLQVGPQLLAVFSSSVVIAPPPWWSGDVGAGWLGLWTGRELEVGRPGGRGLAGSVDPQGEDARAGRRRARGRGCRPGRSGRRTARGPSSRPGRCARPTRPPARPARARASGRRTAPPGRRRRAGPVELAEGEVGQDGPGLVLSR